MTATTKGWRATTASGTVYSRDADRGAGVMCIDGQGRETYFHNPSLRSFPPSFIKGWTEVRWAILEDLPLVKVPVVGEHLYVSSLHQWRISTPIVAVEVIE